MMVLIRDIISRMKWRLLAAAQTRRNRRLMGRIAPRAKVFCIGLNKTGTTSWAQAMSDLGYVVGSETRATMLYDDWARRDFQRIIDYCRTDGQAFQDIPFSLPDTCEVVDRAFPGSKFVLTVRDSAEQWYDSLVTFHGKHFASSGRRPPSPEDLAHAIYWRHGLIADFCRQVFKTPIDDPYNREALLDFYINYNQKLINHFAGRPDDFLVVNVAKHGDYRRMCEFLGFPDSNGRFPWKNKTQAGAK